jgi:hypothetical protein
VMNDQNIFRVIRNFHKCLGKRVISSELFHFYSPNNSDIDFKNGFSELTQVRNFCCCKNLLFYVRALSDIVARF